MWKIVCVTKLCMTKLCVKDCLCVCVEDCVCMTKLLCERLCVWQSCYVKDCVCVWQSCVWQSCVWQIVSVCVCVSKIACDKVVCERLCVCDKVTEADGGGGADGIQNQKQSKTSTPHKDQWIAVLDCIWSELWTNLHAKGWADKMWSDWVCLPEVSQACSVQLSICSSPLLAQLHEAHLQVARPACGKQRLAPKSAKDQATINLLPASAGKFIGAKPNKHILLKLCILLVGISNWCTCGSW